MRAALVASCLRGALPPVDLRAVCLVRAIVPAGCDVFPGLAFGLLRADDEGPMKRVGFCRVKISVTNG